MAAKPGRTGKPASYEDILALPENKVADIWLTMGGLKVSEKDGAATLDIVVQPRCSREGVGPVVGDRLKVSVNAPPVDGKANEAVQRVLAETFGVPRSAVTILRGETGKRKTVRIAGVTVAVAAQVIARF